jgi:acetyl esterase/lipase
MAVCAVMVQAAVGAAEGPPAKPPRPKVPPPDVKDVRYGPYERNCFDLWKAKTAKPAPLLVYIHGGGFYAGDKSSIDLNLLRLCQKLGITLASINYRYSQEAVFPAPMLDSARAIQYLRSHAAEYHIDPTRVAADGGSAGAGITLWIGFHPDLADPTSKDPVARQSTRLSCLVVGGAQSSYDPRFIAKYVGEPAAKHPAILKLYGLKPEEADTPRAHKMFEEAAPINYVAKDSPPVIMFYGESAAPIPPNAPPGTGIHHVKFGLLLKEKMDRLGVECIVHHPELDKGIPADQRVELGDFLSKYLRLEDTDPDARTTFNRVRFFPAAGREKEMLGGKFAGSNVSARSGYEVLTEIQAVPPPERWTELHFPNRKRFRWIRYEAPPGSHGQVAELEFYAGATRVGFGHFGSLGHLPGDYRTAWGAAVDGNTSTAFNSDVADGQYVGTDMGFWSDPPPVMEPAPGAKQGPVQVTLKCCPPDAVIRYSFSATPGPKDGQVYSGPITIDHTATLFAVAFRKGLAPSPTACGTYLIGPAKPGLSTFHIGNSLNGNALRLNRQVQTAGREHTCNLFLMGGADTVGIWNTYVLHPEKPNNDKKSWATSLASLTRLDEFTVQPYDVNLAREAEYDIKFFDAVRGRFPHVQPWFYAVWAEMFKPARAAELGQVPSFQMKTLYPALTWEESAAARLLFVEDLKTKVLASYAGEKKPRILPSAIATGWLKNWIDHGKIPGIAPTEFPFIMFQDNFHQNPIGCYLVNLTWYAAFYGDSPVGKVLPFDTELKPQQAAALQCLAWDVVKNYPDCGLYEEGTTPAGPPQFSPAPAKIKAVTQVTLSSSTPGAWFRYTLDGTVPTRTRGYVYCGVISVRPGMTVKAVAYKSGMADSSVAEASFP